MVIHCTYSYKVIICISLETCMCYCRRYRANAKQHSEAELLLLENYSHSLSTFSSKNNRTYSKKISKIRSVSAFMILHCYNILYCQYNILYIITYNILYCYNYIVIMILYCYNVMILSPRF